MFSLFCAILKTVFQYILDGRKKIENLININQIGVIPAVPSTNYFCIYVQYNNFIGRELEMLVRILQ